MLPSRSVLPRVLALGACLLTLAASGDDFCVVRLMFPTALPAAALPEDDPNTDFVEAIECQTARPAVEAADRADDLIAAGPLVTPSLTVCSGRLFLPVLAASRHCSFASLPPLRC
jgi:hypothetical protein